MHLYFNNPPYIALIGDIIASRKLEDRARVQEKLKTVLTEVNQMYSQVIASKFTITLGDEFQGLLVNGASTVDIAELIIRRMHPVRIRYGIGVGSMATQIDPERSLGADGPAYHLARKAIDELKVMERKRMEPRLSMKIEIEGSPDIAEIINTIFALNTALKARWAERQREVIGAYLDGGGTQTEVAGRLGIHQSNVQKALSHANFYTYQRAVRTVTQILSDIRGPGSANV